MNRVAILLFVFFGMMDVGLTTYGLTHGGSEINPVAVWVWNHFGALGLMQGKALLLILLGLYFRVDKAHGNQVLWLATFVQGFVALWGLISLSLLLIRA